MSDVRAHKKTLDNGLELLRQVKDLGLDLDINCLEDIIHDAARTASAAGVLLEMCRSARVDSVDALLAREG